MNIWFKGQQLAIDEYDMLFQICVINAIYFLFFFVGLKWRRTVEKSFVEFDVFGWLEMIKNYLAISYKHDFSGLLKM